MVCAEFFFFLGVCFKDIGLGCIGLTSPKRNNFFSFGLTPSLPQLTICQMGMILSLPSTETSIKPLDDVLVAPQKLVSLKPKRLVSHADFGE